MYGVGDSWRGEFMFCKLKIGRAAICVLGFRWFYKPQIGERPTSLLIEWARALGCLQPASLPLRGSTISRYELVAFFVFGFVCGGGVVSGYVGCGIVYMLVVLVGILG